MIYRIVKWIAWAMTIVVLFYVGTAILLLYRSCTTTVVSTPWGTVDTDTAKVGFMEPWSHEPCYEAYREISDTGIVRYYLFKSRRIYYKADHDSSGSVRLRLYYPKGLEKDGEICTDYFRREDIFIK